MNEHLDSLVHYIRGYTEPNDDKIIHRSRTRHPKWAERHDERLAERAAAALAHTGRETTLSQQLSPLGQAIKEIGAPYEGWCLVFDTETTKDSSQTLRFGAFQLRGISKDDRSRKHFGGQLTREALDVLAQAGIFYNPEILGADEIALIKAYTREHGLKCLTRDEFVTFFYRWVYRYGALCIGHNLPFDLSRLAYSWTRGGEDYRNGFSLKLCRCPHRVCFDHPSIRIKTIGRYKAFIRFQHTNPPASSTGNETKKPHELDSEKRDGKFLDTATLGRALFGPGDMSLLGLGKRSGATVLKWLEPPDLGGTVIPEQLDYCRNDVDATWSLYQAERSLYRRHGVSKPMWQIYSEASLGKAHREEMGIIPLLTRIPDFPKDILGYSMAALYGARVEMHIRLQPTEVEYDDFKSQYPTINARLGLHDLVVAKDISVRRGSEVVARVRHLLSSLTLTQLQDPAFWKHLRVFCLVRPCGDRLPVRADFGPDGRNVALPVIDHGLPTWYALPAVIASYLLTGKIPEVLDAFELVPGSEHIPTKPWRFFGDDEYVIDPEKGDIFVQIINFRTSVQERMKAAEKAGDHAEAERLNGVQHGLKLLANATAYGIYVEVNAEDETQESRPITVHALSTWEARTCQIEKPGKCFFSPIGALITSGGWLLLAIAERLARDRRLSYAHMDTDGITLARPQHMSRDDFQRLAAEVRIWFTLLSPYRDQPPILELEKENKWQGKRVPLYFLGVSDKRYALYNLVETLDGPILRDGKRFDIRIRKFSSHGMGTYAHMRDYSSPPHIPEPCAKDSDGKPSSYPLGGQRWSYDLWYEAIRAIETGLLADGNPLLYDEQGCPRYVVPTGKEGGWLDQSAFHQVTLSTWKLFQEYSDQYDGHRPNQTPFTFFTLLPPFLTASTTGFGGAGTLTSRKIAALAAGDKDLMQSYGQIPAGVPFDGPYVRTAAELEEAIRLGTFGWYEREEETGRIVRKILPPGIKTPTIAEVFSDYFQAKEHKAANPSGVGELELRHVTLSQIRVLGKETDEVLLLTAEETDGILKGAEASMDGAQVYGIDLGTQDWPQLLGSYSVSDLMLATGLPRQTIQDLRSGKTAKPTQETIQSLAEGLWLLNPQNPASIADLRDAGNNSLASQVGEEWRMQDIQALRSGHRLLGEDEPKRLIAAL